MFDCRVGKNFLSGGIDLRPKCRSRKSGVSAEEVVENWNGFSRKHLAEIRI